MRPDIVESIHLTTEPQHMQGEFRTSSEGRPERTTRGQFGVHSMRGMGGPLPGAFKTLGEFVREVSDDEEDQLSEMDEDRTYAKDDGSSNQRSTSMNENHTAPASPSAPSPPFRIPSPSPASTNPGASETLQAPSPKAAGVQPHQYPTQTWYNGGVWNNNSQNTMTTDTRDSYNDSSIKIGE